MADNNENVSYLLNRLEALARRQEDISREIGDLRMNLYKLKIKEESQIINTEEAEQAPSSVAATVESPRQTISAEYENRQQPASYKPFDTPKKTVKEPHQSNLEKFIGENLINKIGIAITVIGVAIGAKYAIDHELISPLTRIILGYIFGLGLLGFAFKLKKKYESFSAVLLSGGMAVLYFITFLAYSLYGLYPQAIAFILMAIFTAFTVLAAISYNNQIIAHIGLVGAYAVPFLLSDGSGKVAILFTYMSIINIGILVIAFKKYWESLHYSSFGLTWLIFLMWFITKYEPNEHFGLALCFVTIFFAIFYVTLLAYKIRQKETLKPETVIMLLANSFIFFGVGYSALSDNSIGQHLVGLFTLCNAVIHFIVSVVLYRLKIAEKSLFYFASGLVLVFITIAIPVQLDGNWVTLLWAGEAVLLFWIGRSKNVAIYEKLSYPIMVLAFISIVHDWIFGYSGYYMESSSARILPVFNINFASSLLFASAFGFIYKISKDESYAPAIEQSNILTKIFSIFIPATLLISLYFAFRLEISNYWNQLYADSYLVINAKNQLSTQYLWNNDMLNFEYIWISCYTLLFASVLAFINMQKIKSRVLGLVNIGLFLIALVTFLTVGLYALSELRESYLEQTLSQYYTRGAFNIGIRYVSLAFVALTLVACYRMIRQEFIKINLKTPFDLVLHASIVWIASSELINWLDIAGSTQSYKLGLSILWGVYALFLIVLGIWKKNKPLRIGAIVLFGVTLIKLFFYDISHLETIAKTVVLVSLGILLLIISFLYNKYKHIISDDTEA